MCIRSTGNPKVCFPGAFLIRTVAFTRNGNRMWICSPNALLETNQSFGRGKLRKSSFSQRSQPCSRSLPAPLNAQRKMSMSNGIERIPFDLRLKHSFFCTSYRNTSAALCNLLRSGILGSSKLCRHCLFKFFFFGSSVQAHLEHPFHSRR